MNNSLLLRSLIMYAVCMLIAIFVGYHISTWDDMTSFGTLIAVLVLMSLPFLLKWHHFWLILCWNMTAMVFFLPGRPTLTLVLAGFSLAISLVEHGIKQEAPFIGVRSVFWPLIFLTCVVMATAKLTGGIGLNIVGSANVGGKSYIYFLGGILGYFALTAQQIQRDKVLRYMNAYMLSPVTSIIGDIAQFAAPSAIYYIFLIFPATAVTDTNTVVGPEQMARLGGTAVASIAVAYAMAARYGLRGIFNGGRFWRAPVFLTLFVVSMFGGYRGTLVMFALTCGILFWLEGLFYSRLMPVLCCGIVLSMVLLVPLAEHLPLPIQRTLSVVPFLKVDEGAAGSAKASSDWRLQMWHEVIPEIPHYLLLGKGYSINAEELEKVQTPGFSESGAAGAKLAGDYHNGPLSVIIPFGIWGVIGFLWLLGAGWRVLYRNYKYGDAAFQRINTYLFAAYIAKVIYFMAVFGSFASDMTGFLGMLGMSVAINGGMRQPVHAPQKRASDAWKLAQARPVAVN
jgi:hypothetical protein